MSKTSGSSECNSFSGIDLKVVFDDEEVPVQMFSFKKNILEEGEVDLEGTLELQVFEKYQEFLDKTVNMKATAVNEYGSTVTVFEEKIKFTGLKFGLSVDDLISEETYIFEGV
jgi:hypothetical protein